MDKATAQQRADWMVKTFQKHYFNNDAEKRTFIEELVTDELFEDRYSFEECLEAIVLTLEVIIREGKKPRTKEDYFQEIENNIEYATVNTLDPKTFEYSSSLDVDKLNIMCTGYNVTLQEFLEWENSKNN